MPTKLHLIAAALVAALALAVPPARALQDRDSDLQLSGAEVLLDLVVTDKKGNPVVDLKPGEVEILENGERQTVSSFGLVRVGPRPDGAAAAAVETAPPPPARSMLRDVNLILIVVDRGSVQQGNLVQVARAAERFVNERLATNDLVAVFATTNRLVMLQNFTNNKPKLLEAVRRATQGTSVQLQESLDPAAREMLSAEQSLAGERPPLPGDDASNDARLYATLDRNAAGIDSTFASLRDQIQALSVVNGLLALTQVYSNIQGRKSIVLYSEGFVLADESEGALQAMIAAANRGNFTIYSVSAGGLEATVRTGQVQPRRIQPIEESDQRMTVSGGESGLDRLVRPNRIDNDQALARLAAETGGILLRNSNDLGRGFAAIENDLRAHYALSYTPTRPEPDGSFRSIEVRVARRDVEVRARKGYYAVPGGDTLLLPFERPVLEMLAKAPAQSPADLPVSLRTERFPSPDGWLVPVVLSVDGAALAPRKSEGGADTTVDFEVDAVVLVRDASGRVVSKLSRPTVYRTDRNRLEEFRGQALPLGLFPQPLVLGPGKYSLEVGVFDPNGKRGTVVARNVTIPALPSSGEPVLSTLVLSRSAENVAKASAPAADPFVVDGTTRVVPWASGRFVKSKGDQLIAYFRLRAPASAKYQMQLQFILGDKVVKSTQLSELPPADASGTTYGAPVLSLDTFEPGTYRAVLHIVEAGATKPVATAMASFSVES